MTLYAFWIFPSVLQGVVKTYHLDMWHVKTGHVGTNYSNPVTKQIISQY